MTKERKIIIIVGVVVILCGLFYRFKPDTSTLLVSDEQISIKMKKLDKQSRMIAKQAHLKKRHDAIAALLKKSEKGLLEGKTPALASVNIQDIIKGVIYKAGIEIKSVQVLKPGEPDSQGYIGIPVKFQIDSTTRQLKDILYGIESSKKLFRVTEFYSRTLRRKPKAKEAVKIRTVISVEGYVSNG